jgi:UDP-2,3-diacylglucosamine pyrophosphatase LpxH
MADIRYVVISDLHFGADNSVLTSLRECTPPPGLTCDPATPSPVLTGLVEGLRALTGHQARRPTLILAGDVLDLALSPDEVSATVFGGFVNLALAEDPVFDPLVYYLPGNHDHHLWETAREGQYADYLRALPVNDGLVAPWHTTRMRPENQSPKATSQLLTSLIQRQPGCAEVEVRVVYPNMAVLTEDGARGVVVSHGHFTESIYTFMSHLKDILYPAQRAGSFTDISLWEGENFAWIDFLWSTLGRSGQVGTDLGLVYADLTSAKDLDDLASNLTRGLLARGKGSRWLHPVEEKLLDFVFRREANHLARSERGSPDLTLTPKGRAGLLQYLEGPVAAQLTGELGRVPDDVAFIYGHTHKPFVDRWQVQGFAAPVRIFNTGGWVVDTAGPALSQGGVAVLIDDELAAVSLQLYRQSDDGRSVPVQLLDPASGDEAGSALRAELTARIDPGVAPWSTLSASAAQLVEERHRLQAAIVAERNRS